MKHLLLTILSVTLISFLGLSQDTKAVFFSHDLGKFYLYINSQLVERSPAQQVQYMSTGINKLRIKIVFQDHNLKPVKGDIKLKPNKVTVFVTYQENGNIKFEKHDKVKIGQYKPGYVALPYFAMPEYKGRLGCNNPCKLEIINKAISQMNGETMSVAQFTIASSLVKNNCITVADLELVLNAFTYETDKVEFAKFAWAYIYDQENYSNLSSAFEYPQTM